jgi:ribonuclease HI
MNKEEIIIFCDGASKGNPGPGGWGAVVAIDGKVSELGGFDKHTTNNKMELTGALEALTFVDKNKTEADLVINTDSKYVINGMTAWIFGWQKNGWKTKSKEDVSNRDLWEKLALVATDKKIKWNYIGGHIGVAGNERCDEIASDLASGKKVDLYTGKLSDYDVNINDLGHDEVKKAVRQTQAKKSNSGVKAFSYVSLVCGVVHKDATWPECEKRVKGTRGAKYQKAISPLHEQEILKNWGINE